MDDINLYSRLQSLPDDLKSEVADFIDFLLIKTKKKQKRTKPKFGSGKGIFVLKSGFDEPIEDFKEYMF